MEKYQKEVDEWFKEKGWQYWEPFKILARLYEESGEFAREVSDIHGGKPKRADEKPGDVEMEMGDIIYTLICYANSNKIDLDNCMRKALDKVMKRDKDRY